MGQGFLGHTSLEPSSHKASVGLGSLAPSSWEVQALALGGGGGGPCRRDSSRTFSPKLGSMARISWETDTQWTSQMRAGGSCTASAHQLPPSVSHSLIQQTFPECQGLWGRKAIAGWQGNTVGHKQLAQEKEWQGEAQRASWRKWLSALARKVSRIVQCSELLQ